MGVLYTRSDVAHTDPGSVVVDCGICHTLCCEWTDGSHSVWMDGWMDDVPLVSPTLEHAAKPNSASNQP